MLFYFITISICVCCGFKIGKLTNGMSGAPRQCFNRYTGPLMAIVGAVCGIVAGLSNGAILASVLKGGFGGFCAGLLGLCSARLLQTSLNATKRK